MPKPTGSCSPCSASWAQPISAAYSEAAQALKAQIQAHFWNPASGTFRYLVDAQGGCDAQEGLGHALALLFGQASPEQAHSILQRQVISPAGIPCVWPTFERYRTRGGFGRHSGTVWPFISGFWGEAALRQGRPDLFEREFFTLTMIINQHGQCGEIYHPETGELYGGLQEGGGGADGWQWDSCARQSWTASAYVRLVVQGLCGLQFTVEGVKFQPYLPAGIQRLHLGGLRYRDYLLDVSVEGKKGQITARRCNEEPFLLAEAPGAQNS